MIRRPATAKINLALVVGPRRRRRQARGRDRPPAARARRPASRSSRRTRLERRTASPTTRSSAARSRRSPRRRRSSRRWRGRRSRSGSRSRPASAAAARTPPTALRARERDLDRAAARPSGCTSSPRRSAPTCRSSSTPGPQLGEGDGTSSRRSTSAGLHRRARPPGRRGEALDRRRSTRASTSAAARTASTSGARRCSSAALERPATSPRCRPTTSRRSPLAAELRGLGAFRADVSGAGPTVYGLFADARRPRPRQPQPWAPSGGPGSRRLRGTVDRDVDASPAQRSHRARGPTRPVAPRRRSAHRPLDRRPRGPPRRRRRRSRVAGARRRGGDHRRLLLRSAGGSKSDTARQAAWIAAASQALVVARPACS